MANSTSVRIGIEYFDFDKRLQKNIIKADGENTSQVERASLIVKFFKSNNNIYNELITFIIKQQGVENV